MMITKSDKSPVSSFDASLQAVLRAGANKEVKVKFATRQLATRFIHRLNGLRLAMRKVNHPDWEQLYRCGIHREKNDNTTVVLSPRDSEFGPFIEAAGITPTAAEYTKPTTEAIPVINTAEEFLASLKDLEKK